MDRRVPQISLKERRERTVTRLCELFAQDHLELEEFEQRLDIAHRARTAAELDTLLADLPAETPTTQPASAAEGAVARGGRALREAVRGSRTLVAFMGGVERKGQWTPARKNVVIAMMGGVDLDFREVDLPPGETEVFVLCLMGGADIVVPPGLAVDASGTAIMGGFEHASATRSANPNAPVLRISGLCIMGGVDISTRYPGESVKDARLRVKEETRRMSAHRRELRDGE